MDRDDIREAAALLVEARRSGILLAGLPDRCRPKTVADAHAIQDEIVAALGDRVAGWKASATAGSSMHGAILESRVVADGGTIEARSVPLLGVEAEVAFRFDYALAPRDQAYSYAEVAAAVTAFPAVEIVDSRFRDYRGTPLIDRAADFMSNGAFVKGAAQPRWRDFDLVGLRVRLELDGVVVVDKAGGHPAGDPLLPAVEMVNDLRRSTGVRARQFVTTGAYTGLHFASAGQRARAVFDGFGTVEVDLKA